MNKFLKVKRDIAREIENLATILSNEDLIRDPSPLMQAASSLRTNTKNANWRSECYQLEFVISETYLAHYKRVVPTSIEGIALTLTVKSAGEIPSNPSSEEMFDVLNVEISVVGITSGTPDKYYSVWHLDRNISNDTAQESRKFIHPKYHFQFGGDHLPNGNYGQMLITESPRFAHPPLDIVLACDFVLTNYFPGKWQELRENPSYSRIIYSAQQRCWKPYANAINSGWNSPQKHWDVNDIWPQITHSS